MNILSAVTENVPESEPPFGVLFLAVLNIVVGIFSIFTGITIDYIMIQGELTLVSSIQLGAILVGLIQLIAGYGLYTLKSWAWFLAVVVTFIGLVINLLIVTIDFHEVRFYFLPMLIRLVILVYLMSVNIKSRFR